MLAAPAGAATTNPCKVLKKSEIQQAFGGTVSSGKKGLSTPVSAQCEFQVGAERRPSGGHGHRARDDHRRQGRVHRAEEDVSTYVPIDGVPNSLYAEKLTSSTS